MRLDRCQDLVRFFALLRIKPHAPPLVRAPVNSFEFHFLRTYYSGAILNALTPAPGASPPTPGIDRLRRGLLGYLILFAPHAFGNERQCRPRPSPSPLVFLHISTHFTATHGIPRSSAALQPSGFHGSLKLSFSLLPQTLTAACSLFTPNDSG